MEISERSRIAYSSDIGCEPSTFRATVYIDDEEATGDQYKKFTWTIEYEQNEGDEKVYTLYKTWDGEALEFWLPYGSQPGFYRITATYYITETKKIWAHKRVYRDYSEEFPNACICKKGKVKHGKITGKEPGPGKIKVTYNEEGNTYTSILPKCPYKAAGYTFKGWEHEKKIYKPGSEFVGKAEPYHFELFNAKWTPKFEKPTLVAEKSGKKKIKLKWSRMMGAKGYKIYRATKRNGKYKLVKTVKSNRKTKWTDRKIKKGRKYYYKVAAFKGSRQKKSDWALASTKAGKVKSVTLDHSSVKGAVGGSDKM